MSVVDVTDELLAAIAGLSLAPEVDDQQELNLYPWDMPVQWPKPSYETNFEQLLAYFDDLASALRCFWNLVPASEKGYVLRAVSEVTTKHIRMCKYKAKIDWSTVYKTLEDPVASLTDWRQRWTLTHSEADKLALWTQYVGLCVVAQCFMSKDDV